MGLAEMVDAPVILIGDIDRGGMFASLIGTLELLTPVEKKRIKGFIINKFRGDFELLKPGIDFLEDKTGLPVFGIVPYLKDIKLPDEDGVALEGKRQEAGGRRQEKINIVVTKLPRISNFTDFDPFRFEPDIYVQYVTEPAELDGADAIIIPGSKNTLEDMEWLRRGGLADAIIRYAKNGGRVIGICGGFQMLGRIVKDPHGVESHCKETKGLGLLDAETILEREKKTYQVKAIINTLQFTVHSSHIKGYEIHMGETVGNCPPFAVIINRNGSSVKIKDGAISDNCKILGTYIHGVFDNDEFRTGFLSKIRLEKGAPLQEIASYQDKRDEGIKRLAEAVSRNVDVHRLYEIAGLSGILAARAI